LRDQAVGELRQKAITATTLAESQNGLARLIDLRNDLSDTWNRFLTPPDSSTSHQMSLNIPADRFPYMLAAATSISIQTKELFVQINPAFTDTYAPDTLKFCIYEDGTTGGETDLLAMTQWKTATLKGTTTVIGKPPGKWVLKGRLADSNPDSDTKISDTKIQAGAIVQAFLVVYYVARWQ
jgi:hypothetical protein